MPTPVMLPEPFGYVPFPGEFYRPEQLSAEVKNDPFVTRVYSGAQMHQAILEAEQRLLESMKFHPQASHISPNYRDWWNKTCDDKLAELASRPTPTVKQSLTVAPEKASKT